MEKTTSTIGRSAILVFLISLFLSPALFAQTVLHTATFETGNDGWTLNSNAIRSATVAYSTEGTYSIRIRRSTGEMRSPTLALNAYDKVDLVFHFTNRGYDTNETFDVEYRPDGSSSWTIINSFVAGSVAAKTADFQSGFPGIDYAKTVTIFKTDHTFPVAATGQFRFSSNSSSGTDRVYIDDITISGTTYQSISEAPGGVNSNLELWLRTDKVDGSGSLADNTSLTNWEDVGKGNDAVVRRSYQAPTYYDNSSDNINFNPVLDFDNNNNLSGSDMDYLDNKDEMYGTGGFYSHDIFMVVVPDQTITNTMIPLDTFTSTDPTGTTFAEDVTGFGYGAYTQRFTGEYFAYCIGTTTGPGNGYGKGDLDFTVDLNQVAIINARHNDITTPTGENVYFNNIQIAEAESDAADFAAVSNTRYWLGRSQYWNGSFGGRITEVITYSSTNTDVSAADNRNRIQSYLAIKYGITLGVNGVSQDYVDANGNVIWDQSSDGGAFNWDIAGLGRSDAAGLMQKQSKSVNPNTMVTMGMANIEDTNNLNTTDLTVDESYLVWGHDNTSLNAVAPIIVDMSAGVSGLSTIVEFTSVERTWKVVETGGDVQRVEVRVPEADLAATLNPPGEYLMFISDTPSFSPTSEYRIMRLNGANLETTYDFNGTKYITFGYAPENIYVRSVDFDGSVDYMDSDDYLDLDSDFTLSAWVKRDGSATSRDIISKRDALPYTEGYAMRINSSGHPSVMWTNSGGTQQVLDASVELPSDEWHHIAVTYDGTDTRLYIDGVLDATQAMDPPVANSQHFLIAAADYLAPAGHWDGGIDEVRVWDTPLTVDQIRFIMNQEIIEHSDNTVTGSILPQAITKNDISPVDWSELMAYYPMTTYTFTNIKDESGNGNTAAIKNLDTVDFQTAPLPYESDDDGAWSDANTWLNSNVQYLPGAVSVVDGSTTIDWTITLVDHELTASNNTTVLGLMMTDDAEILVDNNNKLEVTHYLELDGFIDLIGESQLIQTAGSDLERTSEGYIEKDQAGTADTYTYNYWSSPVSKQQPYHVNKTYNLTNVLNDGTDPDNPDPVNWVGGYNGAPTSPISISDFWLFKFDNHPIGDYSAWQYLGPYGFLEAGQGYTMKGPGTGGVADSQNYVFIGKPNNDQTNYEIELSITGGNNYLVGNPFASALDADDFIIENVHLDGTLYFWEHWGGGSHVLGEYQGGYAMYNLSGGVIATSHPDVSAAGLPSKIPGRYVPPGQGFFVAADSDGDIEINNSQRNFVRSGASSVFVFTDDGYTMVDDFAAKTTTYSEPDDSDLDAPDLRTKLRLGFDSPSLLHRQLLLTFDDNTTLGYDRGYDGKVFDDQKDDLSWAIGDELFVIQGIPVIEGNSSVVLPLTAEIDASGEFTIGLDASENLGEKLIPYLRDKEHDVWTNLLSDVYSGTIEAGIHPDRFEIVLRKTPRQQDEITDPKRALATVYAVHQKSAELVNVIAKDAEETIQAVEVYNILGQFIGNYSYSGTNPQESFSSTNMATGAYILKTTTNTGTHTVKILIEK